MRWFGRKAAAQAGSRAAAEAGWMAQLWRQTALPRGEFDLTYGAAAANAWKLVERARRAELEGFKRETLKRMVATLRARQARILPRFAPVEDAARLSELMSFALAMAVLVDAVGAALAGVSTEHLGRGESLLVDGAPRGSALGAGSGGDGYGPLLVGSVVGPAGMQWIGQEAMAMRALSAYWRGEDGNDLRAIVRELEQRLGGADASERSGRGAGSAAEDSGSRVGEGMETGVAGSATPWSRGELGAGSDSGSIGAMPGRPAQVGWRWVDWVRGRVERGETVPNTRGGWLHVTAVGALVVAPDCFVEYEAETGVAAKTAQNRALRLRVNVTRKSREGGVANMFGAFVEGRGRVSGMVFPLKIFWRSGHEPAVNVSVKVRS